MRISPEQAEAAAALLRARAACESERCRAAVSSEVLAAALARVMETPDLDPERMADGMAYVASHVTDPRAVADMMINRIMSDSLR